MQKKALGRGLDALFEETGSGKTEERSLSGLADRSSDVSSQASPDGSAGTVARISVDDIIPNPYQPRTVFEEGALGDLASSVKGSGVLQPVLVRRTGTGRYELIAGERRWRAAKQAGMKQIPALIQEASDEQAVELALIENLQRRDLSPIEAARSYRRLIEEFNLTQEDVGRRIGKDRSSVANTVRLLELPAEVQQLILSGRLSHGHAKALLGLSRVRDQVRLARRAVEKGLSVRQVEEATRKKPAARKTARAVPSPVQEVEEQLMRHLGTRVHIRPEKKGGRISIQYHGEDDLNRLIEIIMA